jgi:hypothetical protein
MFYFPPLGEYYRSQYGPVTYVFGFDQEPQTSQRGFTRTAGQVSTPNGRAPHAARPGVFRSHP